MRRSALDRNQIATLLILLLALGYLGWLGYGALPQPEPTPVPARWFDQEDAMKMVQLQCETGPRPTGSPAGWKTGAWIQEQLTAANWRVETQNFVSDDLPARNILAKAGYGRALLIVAHYDTATQPVPGTEASTATTVAVLLELAQVIEQKKLQNQVWLLFLDAQADGQDRGLTTFLQEMDYPPFAVFSLATLATVSHPLVLAPTSHAQLRKRWLDLAQTMGYRGRYSEAAPDDEWQGIAPTLSALYIPVLEMRETGYPYWHQAGDTCEKIDPRSMAAPGQMLESLAEQNLLADMTVLPTPSPTP